MTPSQYVEKLTLLFSTGANADVAQGMQRYMKDHFVYYGLKAPIRTGLQRKFLQEYGKPDVKEISETVRLMWKQPHREVQYFAIDLIRSVLRKLPTEFIDTVEALIVDKSWWDTVDHLANPVSGPLLARDTNLMESRSQRWATSENMWLNRSAILFQLGYKERTRTDLLEHYILLHQHENEFFIRKAIGWALRQYSKSNPDWVRNFLSSHKLSGLSVREASRYI